jgi:hypothetical protein
MSGTTMKNKKKRGGWSRTLARKKLNKITLYGHYLWCKKEGRDTSWYEPTTNNEL